MVLSVLHRNAVVLCWLCCLGVSRIDPPTFVSDSFALNFIPPFVVFSRIIGPPEPMSALISLLSFTRPAGIVIG